MNNITTLEKVFNRVDELSQNCFDQNVNVNDLSFYNLDSIKIAGESHPLKTIAQRSIAWRLGVPYQYLRRCPPEIQSVNLNYWIEHEKNDNCSFEWMARMFERSSHPNINRWIILKSASAWTQWDTVLTHRCNAVLTRGLCL